MNEFKYTSKEETLAAIMALDKKFGDMLRDLEIKPSKIDNENSNFVPALAPPSKNHAYLVRGAKLQCTCGSRPRPLQMHFSHGVYVQSQEFANANASDCIPGEYAAGGNIPPFGVCSVTQLPCAATFVGGWQVTNTRMLIGAVGEPQLPALTTQSFLICKNGGKVTPLNSGQPPWSPPEADFELEAYAASERAMNAATGTNSAGVREKSQLIPNPPIVDKIINDVNALRTFKPQPEPPIIAQIQKEFEQLKGQEAANFIADYPYGRTDLMIEFAQGEIGTRDDGKQNVKYNNENGQPWCAYFAQDMAAKGNVQIPKDDKGRTIYGTGELYKAYKREDRLGDTKTHKPKPGDIILYDAGHTGMVEKDEPYTDGKGGVLTTIEGNTFVGEDPGYRLVCRKTTYYYIDEKGERHYYRNKNQPNIEKSIMGFGKNS